jgi:hypothetical protein
MELFCIGKANIPFAFSIEIAEILSKKLIPCVTIIESA